LKKEKIQQQVEKDLASNFEDLPKGKMYVSPLMDCDVEALKQAADKFRESAGAQAVGLFTSVQDGKLLFACAVTDELVKAGVKAGELVGQVAKAAGGGGGGKPHLATAGGKQPDKLEEAIEVYKRIVREKLS
jgi:alanyl-tRNA synthetase